MLYTDTMQTKVGVHFHVTSGPPEVQLYNHSPLAGPFMDLVLTDMDDAHKLFTNLVDQHLPGYLDDGDRQESYEYLEHITFDVEREETAGARLGIDEFGLSFEVVVCAGCVPKGMN